MRRAAVFAILLLLAACFAFSQQQPAAPPQNVLRAGVSEVIVPVTVTSMQDKFVSNLKKEDFKIFDEGREQDIKFFSAERNQPVVIGYLIDLSNMSRLHWQKFLDVMEELVVNTMIEPKRFSGYLIGFSNEAELMVNTTNDPEKILARLRKTKPGGGAALYDALYRACTSRTLVVGEPIEPRRVIVIVGDGHDNASKKGIDEVLELAQRNLVTVYGVSTVAFGFTSEGTKNLERLASATGGRVVYPLENVYKDVSGYLSTPSDEGNYALKVGTGGYASALLRGLVDAVAATAGEITTQYILRYTPSDTDVARAYRRIRVEVNVANVKVRAREGYYPFKP